MIYIDDAGSGSLVGGTCIGILRTETHEYYYDIIPLSYYTSENFKNKLYIKYVVEITKNIFKIMGVDKKEKIYVCQGYIFEELRKWLTNEKYYWYNVKISEPLQNIVEKTFENYITNLGIPEYFIKYTKYPFHFHRLLKWVYADYENRVKLCKTGWKSFKKYGYLNINISYAKMQKNNYYCLKCGNKIEKNDNIKILEFISNKPNLIILHEYC